jgi:hypothetical protein
MAQFPFLQSGAVCQYPARVVYQQSVEVLRFMDGSDQRFLRQGRQFRQWEIRLDLLSDDELVKLEEFFESRLGDYSTFDFPDPFSNTLVNRCYFGSPEMISDRKEARIGGTSLWVVEVGG